MKIAYVHLVPQCHPIVLSVLMLIPLILLSNLGEAFCIGFYLIIFDLALANSCERRFSTWCFVDIFDLCVKSVLRTQI